MTNTIAVELKDVNRKQLKKIEAAISTYLKKLSPLNSLNIDPQESTLQRFANECFGDFKSEGDEHAPSYEKMVAKKSALQSKMQNTLVAPKRAGAFGLGQPVETRKPLEDITPTIEQLSIR